MAKRRLLGIDLNADLGEGCPHDAALLERVSSANICCGAHAGDPATLLSTLKAAREQGVRVGAHPGYFDRGNFGRAELRLPEEQLWAELIYQVSGLLNLADLAEVRVEYLKPHGALYNQACRDRNLAELIVRVADRCDLAIMGLPHSELAIASRRAGRLFFREGFLDRRYLVDGTLAPRSLPDAFLTDPRTALAQAERLRNEFHVDSLCIHGDGENPVGFLDEVLRLAASA